MDLSLLDGLVGLLAIAFLAWAGVVWKGVQAVERHLTDLVTRIALLEQRMTYAEKRKDE